MDLLMSRGSWRVGLFASLAFSLVLAPLAHATVIVVPNNLELTEGNTNNSWPFDSPASMRYQQVFSGSEFGAFSVPHYITQIAFRPDALVGDPFNVTLTSIQINLSTTNATPDGLSTTFADNIGADETVVFSGPLSISSSDVGGPPRAFDIVMPLTTPFLYDPLLGSLLLDVRNFNGGRSESFDAHQAVGDSVSRAFSFDVNDPVAFRADSYGLVTEFTATPVPEPSTLVLLLTGFLGGGVAARRRRG